MNPEHEHLLRRNIGYWHAYGHLWRDEQREHEREYQQGYRGYMLSESDVQRALDNRSRGEDMRLAK